MSNSIQIDATSKNSKTLTSSSISSSVIATTVVVFTEIMFFTALISAFLVIRAGHSNWSVPTDVTLPILATGINTIVLFLSGWFLWLARRALQNSEPQELKYGPFFSGRFY